MMHRFSRYKVALKVFHFDGVSIPRQAYRISHQRALSIPVTPPLHIRPRKSTSVETMTENQSIIQSQNISSLKKHTLLLETASSEKEIRDVLEDLETKKYQGRQKHYMSAVTRLNEIGCLDKAVGICLFMHERKLFNPDYLRSLCMHILTLCKDGRHLEIADKLLSKMEETGGDMAPESLHYREVIKCCSKTNSVKIKEIIMRMNKSDCSPCIHVYNAALTRLCRASNVDVAMTLLDEMRNTPGLAPDLYSFNTILACCSRFPSSRAKNMAKEMILKTMPWCAVVPSEYSYGLAMTVCIKVGKWEEALQLYGHYCDQEKGTVSDKGMPLKIFKGVLLACTKGNEADVALEIVNYITRNDHKLITEEDRADALECYNMGITACCNGDQTTAALSIYEYIDNHQRIRPDMFTCSAAIRACSLIGDWETATALLWTAEHVHQMQPNTVMYSTLMTAHCPSGNWQEIEKIIHHMLKLADKLPYGERSNVYPNNQSFEALFRAGGIGKTSEPVRKWFKKWKVVHEHRPDQTEQEIADGNKRDIFVFKSALDACIESRDWDMALAVLVDYRDMHKWIDNIALKQSTPPRRRSLLFEAEFSHEEKWERLCDSLLMRVLMHSSEAMAKKILYELQHHRYYHPHQLVVAFYERRFRQRWHVITANERYNDLFT